MPWIVNGIDKFLLLEGRSIADTQSRAGNVSSDGSSRGPVMRNFSMASHALAAIAILNGLLSNQRKRADFRASATIRSSKSSDGSSRTSSSGPHPSNPRNAGLSDRAAPSITYAKAFFCIVKVASEYIAKRVIRLIRPITPAVLMVCGVFFKCTTHLIGVGSSQRPLQFVAVRASTHASDVALSPRESRPPFSYDDRRNPLIVSYSAICCVCLQSRQLRNWECRGGWRSWSHRWTGGAARMLRMLAGSRAFRRHSPAARCPAAARRILAKVADVG